MFHNYSIKHRLVEIIALHWYILILSCNPPPDDLSFALQLAGDNSSELIKVLDHYSKNEQDSLKYRAARFLIENMPGHFSYNGNDILSYYEEIIGVLDGNSTAKEKKDSIEKIATRYPSLKDNTIEDVQLITAEYLIKNIDHSFKLWEKPWARHLNFEEFCEHLLPYKYAELQILDAWKDTLGTKFCKDINNMPENDELGSSTFHIAQVINTEIRHTVTVNSLYHLGEYNGYDFLSANTIHKLPFGLCPEYVALGVMALRSHGIPVVAEYTPLWGRSDTGHSWYSILNDDGSYQPSHYDISSHFGATLFPTKKMPKIYRQRYSRNPEVSNYLQNAKHTHTCVDLFQTDVTDHYIATSDVAIPLFNKDLPDKYAYIATFNGSSWMPVDYGKIKDGNAFFKKMGRDLLYIVLSFDGIKMEPVSHPFIIHKNGEIQHVIADTSQHQSVKLWRKYPKSLHVAEMQKRMFGGKIQAANKRDFSDSITLYTIKSLDYPDRIPLDTTGLYRYWRYLAPEGSYGNIAELVFFDLDQQEKWGEIIGTPGDNIEEIKKAFDNDWFTCYDTWTKEKPWVGMDFGKPLHISMVRCIPRTDDNYIHNGDQYELKYWNNYQWQTLGTRIADENYILYDGVPKALLWLSNLSRGKQERVFMYVDEKQVWW